MKFKKEFMIDLVYGELEDEDASIVEDKIIETSRWSVIHKIVFKFNDKFYESNYSIGATEMQDEGPYEYSKNEIECPEVRLVEKLMKVYERV